MTKADLVDKVTALGDLTRRDGEIIVDTLFESVIGALKSGDKIEIRRPATRWMCRPSGFRSSSLQRSCATQ
jgi:nucleoid DNA-binding protein